MVLPDDELNRLKVGEPWARLADVEQGPDAVQSWEYEDSSPPLDLMPVLTPTSLVKLKHAIGLAPSEDTVFCATRWGEISKAMDEYLLGVCDLQKALRA